MDNSLPDFIQWTDAEPNSKSLKIGIQREDLVAIAPLVVKAIIAGQLKQESPHWAEKRQQTVEIITKLLSEQRCELPQDRAVYSTYIAASSAVAYWQLLQDGLEPDVAARSVTENAMKMLDALHDRTVTTEE